MTTIIWFRQDLRVHDNPRIPPSVWITLFKALSAILRKCAKRWRNAGKVVDHPETEPRVDGRFGA
jgi:deoxyribodipyrimidine photolyase